MLSLSPSAPAASAAQPQLKPEQVPSLEQRTDALGVCLGGLLPSGLTSLVAKYAMERFDGQIFGPEQWKRKWGAMPVILPPVEKLRDQVNQLITSTGKQPEKNVEEMSADECANFLGLPGVEEHLEPSEEMYECLNRRVRPEDICVAGFTCVVTSIPQFVSKEGRILAVTARTLALEIGPNPEMDGRVVKLGDPNFVFDQVLFPEDATRNEPSCYFMMELDIAPNTRGKKPSILTKEICQQGDKGWQLPETRNFFAAVFSRRVWKGQFLYGGDAIAFTYGLGNCRLGRFLALGGNEEEDFFTVHPCNDSGLVLYGASSSRKFRPCTILKEPFLTYAAQPRR